MSHDVSRLPLDGADRGELDVAPTSPALPVDHVALPVDAQPDLLPADAVRLGLPLAGETDALPVEKSILS